MAQQQRRPDELHIDVPVNLKQKNLDFHHIFISSDKFLPGLGQSSQRSLHSQFPDEQIILTFPL